MPHLTDVAANAALDNMGAMFAKLHIGDPTNTGTGAPSVGFPGRAPAQLGPAAARARTNTANIDFATPSAAAETISWVSLWSAATAGECRWRGPLTTPMPVALGEKFRLDAGELDLTID